MTDIRKALEEQIKITERKLDALKIVAEHYGMDSHPAKVPAIPAAAPKKRKKTKLSAEGRKRIAEAVRARWAAQKAAANGAPPPVAEVKRKPGRPKGAASAA